MSDPQDAKAPRVLGKGQFGLVYLATDNTASNSLVALKVQQRPSEDETNTALREAMEISKLSHPNIVRISDVFVITQPDFRMVAALEYCEHGELGSYLSKLRNGNTTSPLDSMQRRFLREMASALDYLKSRGVIHRDIKCANIFVAQSQQTPTLKLGDFGLSKTYAIGQSSRGHSLVGTPFYLAPEVAEGSYTSSIDMFSMGTS